MPRLAMAIAAAFTLHILLLMIVVPEPQIFQPEIMGSGQVTVSIIRSSPQIDHPEVEPQPRVDEVIYKDEIETQTEVVEEVQEEMPDEKPLQEVVQKVEELEKVNPATEVPKDVPAVIKKQVTESTNKRAEQEASESSVYSSNVETLQDPQPLANKNEPPQYPALARKRGWEGTVILEVDIGSDGMVKKIELKQSSSYAILDKEAMRAVRKWQFQPGSKAGKYIDMTVLVPVHFTLTEQ